MLEVHDDVLDGQTRGVVDALDQVAAQPAGMHCGVGGDDDLIGPTCGDGVHRRQNGIAVADFAGAPRCPRSDDRREREVDTHLRRFAYGLVVDHEAAEGLLWGTTRRKRTSPAARARAHRLEQLGATERAVGDDENFPHRRLLGIGCDARCLLPATVGVGAGAKMPCTAPGTPYS